MVALLNVSLLGFILYIVVTVQANPVLETSNDMNEKRSPISNQQLYELYKIMRSDPRLESVSNKDIVLYIYQNFVLGKGRNIDSLKPSYQPNHSPQNEKMVADE